MIILVLFVIEIIKTEKVLHNILVTTIAFICIPLYLVLPFVSQSVSQSLVPGPSITVSQSLFALSIHLSILCMVIICSLVFRFSFTSLLIVQSLISGPSLVCKALHFTSLLNVLDQEGLQAGAAYSKLSLTYVMYRI